MLYLIDFDNRRCGDLSQKKKNQKGKKKVNLSKLLLMTFNI
jgi:hypothetical protein